MQLEGGHLFIEEACSVAQVSRAGYYRYFDEHTPRQAETELRDRIQRVALEHRCYGYRRVVAELRQQGIVVNRKRVLRVLREDNLLSLRKRKFVVTTDSSHGRIVYPNLIKDLALTMPNQGGRHYLHSAIGGVYFLSGSSGCFFPPRVGMGAGPEPANEPGPRRPGTRADGSTGVRPCHSPFRPGRPICVGRLCGSLARNRLRN